MYGVRNIGADTYSKECKPWYKKIVAENKTIGVSETKWSSAAELMLNC